MLAANFTREQRQDPWQAIVPPAASNICAILVTYQPDAGFSDRLVRLSWQFPHVFVIDNASIDLRVGQSNKIQIHRNDRNIGVAAALNLGLKYAEEAGYAWAVTFDQDSELMEAFTSAMLASVKATGTYRLLLGANYVDVYRRRLAHRGGLRGDGPMRRTTLITSGMLLPVGFARAIGGFREDFFIDSVDHEFCLRASDYGAGLYVTREPLMRHSIGAPASGFRWARMLSSEHPPARKYFIARNTLWAVRLHARRHPLWGLWQFGRIGAEAVGILLFETGRSSKIAAFLRGIKDGAMADMRRDH